VTIVRILSYLIISSLFFFFFSNDRAGSYVGFSERRLVHIVKMGTVRQTEEMVMA